MWCPHNRQQNGKFSQVPTELPNFGFLGSICMFYNLLQCNPKYNFQNKLIVYKQDCDSSKFQRSRVNENLSHICLLKSVGVKPLLPMSTLQAYLWSWDWKSTHTSDLLFEFCKQGIHTHCACLVYLVWWPAKHIEKRKTIQHIFKMFMWALARKFWKHSHATCCDENSST